MKKSIFTLFIALVAGNYAIAQTTSTFELLHNPASVTADPLVTDAEADIFITNMTAAPLHIKWVRTIISNPQNLATQVCDPNNCYFPQINTEDFVMSPNDVDTLIVHFLNETGEPAEEIVHLTISNFDNPSDVKTGIFSYTSFPSGTTDLQRPTVKIFPNPTVDFFTLEKADFVHGVRVFGLDGRQVAYFNATPNNQYSLANQVAGAYIIALENADGQVVQVVDVQKL